MSETTTAKELYLRMRARTAGHTPGPWDNNSRRTVVRQTDSGEWIADVGGRSTLEAHANARLMAAVPTLLEAAEAALQFAENLRRDASGITVDGSLCSVGHYAGYHASNLRAAIARAKGEQS
jgi:hypothetical protein